MTTRKDIPGLLGDPPEDAGDAAPSRVIETVVLRFLARVLHADGVIDPREVELLNKVARTMELGDEEARRILDDELATRSDPAALARQLVEPLHRRSVYALGCMMAASEGHVAEVEGEVLAAFARGAEIPDAEADEILAEAVKQTG
jgi:uncharacterized membrane protein YebE (DUF533 family)